MRTETSRRAVASWCIAVLIFLPTLQMGGCSAPSTGGNGTSEDVEAFIESNLDPADPEAVVLTGKVRGDRLVIFGEKSEAGELERITAMSYYEQAGDAEPQLAITLDDTGRPARFVSADGRSARLDYDDANDAVVVTYESANGEREVLTFALSSAAGALKMVSRGAATPLRLVEHAGPLPQTAEVVLVRVRLNLVPAASPDDPATVIGPIPDGLVTISASNTVYNIPPATYDPVDGVYQAAVASRVADVDFLVADCEKSKSVVSDGLVAFDVVAGILLALCSGATTGTCALVGTTVASTLIGVGISIGSDQVLKSSALDCRAYHRAAAAGGTGVVTLNVRATVPRLNDVQETTVQYNLLDQGDPITQLKIVALTFNYPTDDCGGCAAGQLCNGVRCVQCMTRDNCAAGLFCDLQGNCVECLTADNCKNATSGRLCLQGHCGQCTTDQQCVDTGLGRVCGSSGCVECETDDQCQALAYFACVANECKTCSTDDHCRLNGIGAACRENFCVECVDNGDCDVLTERCDLANNACVPDDGPSSDFTILSYFNTDCNAENPTSTPSACGGVNGLPVVPSAAQIQLSGNAARPTISWSVPNAFTLLVTSTAPLYGLTGTTAPDPDGETSSAPFAFSSVTYGDYSRPNTEAGFGVAGQLTTENATDLQPGVIYSVTIGTLDAKLATLSFRRD